MRRFRESGAAAFVVACALLVVSACFDEPVGVESEPQYDVGPVDAGSHFRYATLSWAPTATPNEIRFRLIAAFRRTAYDTPTRCFPTCAGGFPGVGDTILENQGGTRLNFGDASGTTGTLRFAVTAIDTSDPDVNGHWVLGEALDPGTGTPGILHTYLSDGHFNAGVGNVSTTGGFARIGQAGGIPTVALNNRAGGFYAIHTDVHLSGNSSPTSSMAPIVVVVAGTNIQFPVPAADPDGDVLFYRLSSDAEAGGGTHPPGLSINSSTGLMTWDNATLNQVDLWTTQVIVEDGTTRTPVDFLLRISGAQVGAIPTCTIGASGPLAATVGTAISFDVSAEDADGGNVTLNGTSLPVGATMTPTLPVTGTSPQNSTFDWTPASGQEGTNVVQFSATDPNGQQGSCAITIEVNIIGPDGGDIPVTDETGVVLGTVNIPEGALPNNTVIVAQITNDPTCANVDGAEGVCLTITVPSGTVLDPGAFITVGLCFVGSALPPPEFAIFRTDDDGTVVLQNVLVDLDCGSTTGSLDVERNLLSRFASSVWQRITGPFRPQPLYATLVARRRLGGLSGSFSDFVWAPQLFVQMALAQNRRRAGTDMILIHGTYPFDGGTFNPEGNEDVDISFGDCIGPCVELHIDGDDFVRDDDEQKYTATVGARNARSKVEIFDNGRFKIDWQGLTIDDIMTVGEDGTTFVSFILGIGERLTGVGLQFDDKGRCHRANSAQGCGDPGI